MSDLNTFDAKTFMRRCPADEGLDLADPAAALSRRADRCWRQGGRAVREHVFRHQRLPMPLRPDRRAPAARGIPGAQAPLLVDTHSASLGEGLLVMRAVDCRREGMSIDDTYTFCVRCGTHGADLHGRRPALPPQDRPPVQSLEAAVGTCCRSSPCSRATWAGQDRLLRQARGPACHRGHCQAL